MAKLTDEEIIQAWHTNATPWIKAIDNQEIESRKLVTNNAIIDLISDIAPKEILDVGCGEGWLSGELTKKGFDVFGIDVVPALIEKAKQIKGARFDVCSYENLAAYPFNQTFDCVLCNFALLGEASTEAVVGAARKLLSSSGRLVIQTLHPIVACGDGKYEDGWREGSWAGFSSEFTRPAPWYFRTIGGWIALFAKKGFCLHSIHEPLHPKTNKPASIILDLH